MAKRSLGARYSCAAKSAAANVAIAALAAAACLVFPASQRLVESASVASARYLALGLQTHTGPAPKMPKMKTPEAKNAATSGPVSQPPIPPAQLTNEDLTSFFDGMVPIQIERDDIAGAVVAVVKDGQVIFAKGYGYMDPKDKKPVTPDGTLFRVGSISKLFTWTAVMQLVEQGKIDLDADVNQYLDYHINEPLGKITMRDLMTHTPGFEEAIKDLISDNAANLGSLGDYLKQHQPKQIFPPGSTGAYSNYGAGMAGYIVQRVSGQPFDDYIEQHIFQPLGITHASFRQPLPANLDPMMSQGFILASSGPKAYELVNPPPAGALAISAMDITHFMIAHLQDGTYNGAQILRPETVKEMHSRQYGPAEQVNGMCLGFYEDSRNAHRVIAHGGDTIYFHSDLHLILDANVGLFVSVNSAGRGEGGLRGPLYKKFMDRYFPYTRTMAPAPSVAEATSDAQAASGTYIASRRPQTNILYLIALLGEEKVVPGKDGTLITAARGLNGQPIEWHEEAQNVWYDPADPQDKAVLTKDYAGEPMLAGEFPAEQMQRIDFFHSQGFVQNSLIGVLGILALTLILWPIAALIRWHYGWKIEAGEAERRARGWARVECALVIAFWVAFLATLTEGMQHLNLLSSASDGWFRVIQIIGWLGVIGTLIAIWNFFVSVGTPGRWWWAKVTDTLILLACLMNVWLIWITHLLHFSLLY
jgi:CubicO group peptidase (beta-lactamase class C family)